MTSEAQKFIIQGHGGGGKKGGGSSEDDTMRSFAHARLVDAISEGEIEGLVDGANSILINRTPLPNIKEAAWQFRAGLPDDEPMVGINTTEAYTNVGAEVSQELGPVIRTITDTKIDGIKLLMQLNTLYRIDNKKGGLKTTDSGWKIEIRRAGGSWETFQDFELKGEKASSPVQFQHIIPTTGAGPWDIRISAKYGDRDDIEQNITWTGYSTVTGGRFIHPHTAMVALALSSEHVGASTPTRHYHIKGRKILVPTNYNPLTRVYSGVWDGTFKRVWSNNPAWVFYDMVENNIFGIGAEVDAAVANKWRLYTIAQYCDQLVPSGYRDSSDNMVMEPRFTFNGTITDKKEAFDALRSMTTVWRGMGFYALNQFFTTIDMPQDAAHIYGPANVVDGRFEYSTSSIKARNSVVMVRFNDPNNLFEPAIEPYVDDELLKKFGWREKTLELAGCSSRSLAHRYGKWVTETEKRETETVMFTVGLDSIHALPGEVIAINDPRRAQTRVSGRVRSMNKSARTVTLDQAIDAAITGSLTLRVQGSDGQLRSFTGTVNAGDRAIVTVTNSDAFDFLQTNAVFIISSSQVAPREYRIITIDEEQGGKFKITALQYDRLKYAAVEQGIEFDPLPVKLNVSTLEPPTNLQIENRAYTDGGRVRNDLEITWSPSPSLSVMEYRIYADTPTETNVLIGKTGRSSVSYSTYEPGAYVFRVVAASITGSTSDAIQAPYTVEGAGSIAIGSVMDLVNAATMVGGSNVEFKGSAVRLSWRNMMKVSSVVGIAEVDTDDTIYSHTTLEFYFGATKVRTERVRGNTFTYTLEMNRADASAAGLSTAQRAFSVRASVVDKDGRTSAPTTISLVNNAPPAIAPTISVEEKFLNISWSASNDEDVAGYLVFVQNNNGSVVGVNPTQVTVANSHRFQGVALTDYWVTVVGYDAFGRNSLNYATPLYAKTSYDGSDVQPPDTPTGLSLSGVLNAKTSLVDVTASWTAISAEDADQYQFEITIQGISSVLTTNHVTTKFSVAQADAVTARVRVMDKTFNWSAWSAPVVYNAPTDTVAPATPATFTLTPGWGAFALEWTAATENDFSHYEVWESATSTAPVAGSAARYKVTANVLMLTGYTDGSLRYFAVRAVDIGGNKSAWSVLRNATTTSLSLVTLPTPAAGPTVTTSLAGSVADVNLTWSAIANADGYEVEVTPAGGNAVVQKVATNQFRFSTQPGSTGSVRFRAAGALGERSNFSPSVAYTAARDTTAPGAVTGLSAKEGIGMVVLKWAASTATDLDLYEIYQSSTTTAPVAGTVATYKSAATTAIIGELTQAATYHFWVRAVDTSGNKGAWSSRAQATVTSVSGLVEQQISDSTWSASLGFVVPYTGAALPTTNIGKTISWNNKLYTWSGSAYVSAASFADLTFSDVGGSIAGSQIPGKLITAGKIADSTLTAEQIANNAIPIEKLTQSLRDHIASQGTSAAADAAAAQAARLAAQAAASAAEGYKNDTIELKDTVEERSAEITQTAGVVAAAKNTSILASGNERFQFELAGWQMTGGRLTNLRDYRRGSVDAIFIFDAANNVHQGIAVNFARNSTTSVTINGTNYTVPVNRPRFFVTVADGRFLRTSSGETMGLSAALGTVDVEITPRSGAKVVQKNVALASGWWPAFGDYYSVVVWPAGTL